MSKPRCSLGLRRWWRRTLDPTTYLGSPGSKKSIFASTCLKSQNFTSNCIFPQGHRPPHPLPSLQDWSHTSPCPALLTHSPRTSSGKGDRDHDDNMAWPCFAMKFSWAMNMKKGTESSLMTRTWCTTCENAIAIAAEGAFSINWHLGQHQKVQKNGTMNLTKE